MWEHEGSALAPTAIGACMDWVTSQLYDCDRDGIIGLTGLRRLILHNSEALKLTSRREE